MKVLVAINRSASANRAVMLVGWMKWPPGTILRVVTVLPETRPPVNPRPGSAWGLGGLVELENRALRDRERLLLATEQRLGAPDRTVEPFIARGDPTATIIDEGRELGADLIVVGSGGQGPLESLLLGSISAGVADGASSSVLVARQPTLERVVL